MNTKSDRIKQLVEHLFNKFGRDRVFVKDHWQEDENAIGICEKTEQFLSYISIEDTDRFYLALEDPPTDDDFPYTPAGEFNDIPLTVLEDEIRKHLRLDFTAQ